MCTFLTDILRCGIYITRHTLAKIIQCQVLFKKKYLSVINYNIIINIQVPFFNNHKYKNDYAIFLIVQTKSLCMGIKELRELKKLRSDTYFIWQHEACLINGAPALS